MRHHLTIRVKFFAIAFIIVLIGWVLLLVFCKHDSKFYQNYLPEVFGLLVDIVLFGVVLIILENLESRNYQIQLNTDTLDTLRNFKSEESKTQIIKLIRTSNSNKIYKFDLSHCNLSSSKLDHLKLDGSTMISTIWNGTSFFEVSFNGIHSSSSEFSGCTFYDCDFKNSTLHRAHFDNCPSIFGGDMSGIKADGCCFNGSGLSHINFSNGEFYGADFRDVIFGKNMDFSNCKMDGAIVPLDFFEQLDKVEGIKGLEEMKLKYIIDPETEFYSTEITGGEEEVVHRIMRRDHYIKYYKNRNSQN